MGLQQTLAEQTDRNPSTIDKLFNGDQKTITFDTTKQDLRIKE